MAGGLAAGLARGLSTGYGMARDAYQDEQTQKRQAVEDVYKARADERADQASKRENERLELMRSTEQRQQQRLDEQERRQRMTDAATLLEKSNADILARSRARTGAGMPVDPGDEEEYEQNRAALRRIRRQGALNFFSRVSAGTASIDDVSPGDFYTNFTAATDMEPEELAKMPKYIDDIQAGLQTGNQGLVVEATNGLMTPQLRRGVGAPSPYGGVIVKKEIIGLDPARDANGQDHPNRFIPRLRVYVDHPSMQGPRMENGATGYYDTVMTKGGTTEETDLPVAIDIGKAMDWMGNLGVLANAVQNPQVAARLEQGKREKGADAKRYRDDLIAMSRPTKKNTTVDKVDLGDRTVMITRDETGKEISREEMRKGAAPRLFAPPRAGGAGGVSGILDTLEEPDATGDELLASLPPRVAATIKALDEGRMTLKDLPTKGNYRGEIQALWNQYNSRADATKFNTSQRVENSFAVGKQGDTVRSFNVAVEHLDTLNHLIAALGNGDTLAFNKLANTIAQQTGQPAPTNFESARQIVTNEVTKATVGAQNALGDRQEIARTINVASSPAQLQGAIRNYQELMAGQLKGLGTQYYAGGGRKDFSTFLTPRTVELTGGVPRPKSQPSRSAADSGGATTPKGPAVGTVQDGYRFKGGDPASPSSWEKVR